MYRRAANLYEAIIDAIQELLGVVGTKKSSFKCEHRPLRVEALISSSVPWNISRVSIRKEARDDPDGNSRAAEGQSKDP